MKFLYKNIKGTCIYNKEKGVYSGYVISLTDIFIMYRGNTQEELFESFKKSVDKYLKGKK